MFQIFIIHLITSVYEFQLIIYNLASTKSNGRKKRVVHRFLQNNLITWMGQHSHSNVQCGNNPWSKNNPFRFYLPGIFIPHTIDYGLDNVGTRLCISIKFMFSASFQRFNNRCSNGKIHIGYPHWYHIIIPKDRLNEVPLEAICILPIADLIEIVLHLRVST